MSNNNVEVHILDPTKVYPGERPAPLAYIIPRAEYEVNEWGEPSIGTVLDLVHHLKRLESVRKTLETMIRGYCVNCSCVDCRVARGEEPE